MGYLITFEGIDGCGKTTQANMLAKALTHNGFETIQTKEPGQTLLGSEIRKLFLNNTYSNMTHEAEILLLAADRAQHVSEVIKPGLEDGKIIICDRFIDSVVAYQGYGRKIDMKAIDYLKQFTTGNIQPHLTFLIDIPIQEALQRIKYKKDRIENENIDFFERVRNGFLSQAKRYPSRITVIDGCASIQEIHNIIMEKINNIFQTMNILRAPLY